MKKVIVVFLLLVLTASAAAEAGEQNDPQALSQDTTIVFSQEFTAELCKLLSYTVDFYLLLVEEPTLTDSDMKFILEWMKGYVEVVNSSDTARFFVVGTGFPEPGDSVRANVLIYSALIP